MVLTWRTKLLGDRPVTLPPGLPTVLLPHHPPCLFTTLRRSPCNSSTLLYPRKLPTFTSQTPACMHPVPPLRSGVPTFIPSTPRSPPQPYRTIPWMQSRSPAVLTAAPATAAAAAAATATTAPAVTEVATVAAVDERVGAEHGQRAQLVAHAATGRHTTRLGRLAHNRVQDIQSGGTQFLLDPTRSHTHGSARPDPGPLFLHSPQP